MVDVSAMSPLTSVGSGGSGSKRGPPTSTFASRKWLTLFGAPVGHQRGNGDQGAVPAGQFRTGPDVTEQHIVGRLGGLRRYVAYEALSS